MDRRIDLVGSIGVIIFALVLLGAVVLFPDPALEYDGLGPMGMPRIVGWTLLGLGSLQTYRTVKYLRGPGPVVGPSEGTEDEQGFPASSLRAVGFIAGGITYGLTLGYLGYFVATPIAITAGLAAMGYRGWPARIATAVVFALVGFAVFDMTLSVNLPTGILGRLLVDLEIVEFTT